MRSVRGDDIRDKVAEAALKVAKDSFPEIKPSKLRFKEFESTSVFFKSRFSICRYLTFRPMRHVIYFNRTAFADGLPDDALDGILAHELSHVLYYTKKNRFQLAGLAGLISPARNAEFERRADIEAIRRGYGEGLADYRKWLFKHIPAKAAAEKRRDYFSAEEIEMISKAIGKDPQLADRLWRHVPRDREELDGILR